MIPHEEQTREAERQRAYQSIVLKEESSIPLITQEEKAEYPALLEEMKTTVPGMKKLMFSRAGLPHTEIDTLLLYHEYKLLLKIAKLLEEGGYRNE